MEKIKIESYSIKNTVGKIIKPYGSIEGYPHVLYVDAEQLLLITKGLIIRGTKEHSNLELNSTRFLIY